VAALAEDRRKGRLTEAQYQARYRQAVDRYMRTSSEAGTHSAVPASTPDSPLVGQSVAERQAFAEAEGLAQRLDELKDLLESGHISEDEFVHIRRRLLDGFGK
jgi:hypothetical protein